MNRLLLALCALLIASPACAGTMTLLGAGKASAGGGGISGPTSAGSFLPTSGGTFVLNPTIAVPAGNTLVVFYMNGGTSFASGVVDSQGNTYACTPGAANTNGNVLNVCAAAIATGLATSDTVTVTTGTPGGPGILLVADNKAAVTSKGEGNSAGTTSSSFTITATVTGTADVICAAVGGFSGQTMSPPAAGLSAISGATVNDGGAITVAYSKVGTTSNQACGGTPSASSTVNAAYVVLN